MFGTEARDASLPQPKPKPKGSRIGAPWRPRLGALGVILIALIAIGLLAPAVLSPVIPSAQRQSATVQRGPLVTTLDGRGSVVLTRQVPLAFGTTGRVKEINVTLGQSVNAGETLATLETADLEAQVERAHSDLRIAQLRLQQIKDGARPELIEAAKADLAAAQARAQDIANGAPRPEIDAAKAAVLAAEAALASATAKRQLLESGPLATDRAEAEQAVAAARAALQKARSDLTKLKEGCPVCLWWTIPRPPSEADIETARLDLERAKQSLLAEQVSRDAACGGGRDQASCKTGDALVGVAELDVKRAELRLQQLQGTPRADDVAAAERSVESALKALASAEARLGLVMNGPAPGDLQAAQSAEQTAESGLQTARSRLEQLQAGAKAGDRQVALAAVSNAQAALAALTTPRAADVALLEEQARQAELGVSYAELALSSAILKVPFDSVVSSINAQVGEQMSGPTPVITLVDPRAVRIEARVEEAEAVKIQPGTEVQVTFDSLGAGQFPGRVAAVSPLETLQTGPTSYVVSVDFEPGDAHITPGLAASLSMVLDHRDSVLQIPNRAIRRQGRDQMVEVLVDGKSELRPVQTGIANDQFTEIVGGLAEGEMVVLPR